MNDILRTIMDRRSIRQYTDQQIPQEVLDQILQAARYSPNAGNRQTTLVVVCQNRELNEQLGAINRAAFTGQVSNHHKVSDAQPSIADDPAIQSAFYGAPTVITLFAPHRFRYAGPDSWIMASNIALAAYSLGVGSCVIGRARETFDSPLGMELIRQWEIPEDYQAQTHIALGYPNGVFPQPKSRRYPNPIMIR